MKIAILFLCFLSPYAYSDILQARAHGFHWYSADKEDKIKEARVPKAPVKTPHEQLLEMREATLNKLSKALIEPSFDATYDYMKAQQVYAKNNQAFVRFWQEVLMTHPELDHSLNFPTDNSAIATRNDMTNALIERVIIDTSEKYGFILFYEGSSKISQKFMQHLLPFVSGANIEMISVSTDGVVIPGLPNSKSIPLEVVTTRVSLKARYMPALFLVNLKTKQMRSLSYGYVSLTELKERLLDIATNYKRFSYEGLDT